MDYSLTAALVSLAKALTKLAEEATTYLATKNLDERAKEL